MATPPKPAKAEQWFEWFQEFELPKLAKQVKNKLIEKPTIEDLLDAVESELTKIERDLNKPTDNKQKKPNKWPGRKPPMWGTDGD